MKSDCNPGMITSRNIKNIWGIIIMSGIRKRPTLRFDGTYWITTIYKPNGARGTISFGSTKARSEKNIKIAFERWIELYQEHPIKTLSFSSPYEALQYMINPTTITTVGQLFEKYEIYFQKNAPEVRNGLEHPDLRLIRRAHNFIQPYSEWPVDSFGPDELNDIKKKLLKHKYIKGTKQKHYVRRGINDTLKWIKNIIEWGVGRRIVQNETLIAIQKELKLLRMGEKGAKDNIKRGRVTEEEFNKVVGVVTSVIGDMLKLVWHTAMRPYEICEMRPYDILRDDSECWLYIPGRDKTPIGMHKTTRYGKVKVIPLAGEGIDILSKRIDDFDSKEYIFTPKDSVAEFRETKRKNRKTPMSCGNKSGSNRKEIPKKKPGGLYTNNSFAQACKRACRRAGVEAFVPYDLRRTVATKTRAELGKEAAKTLLGHAEQSTTDIYLLEEVQEAMKVAKALAKYAKGA